MALPLLNEAPKYELMIPSMKKKVRYRPFLVKEQKVLMIAFESKDPNQIMHSMIDCVGACVEGVDPYKLATFDIDYMFTQIRSKSVGETTDIVGICAECTTENTVKVDLSKISVEESKVADTLIQLNPNLQIRMKYPTYEDVEKTNVLSEDASPTEVIFNTIYACLDSVLTDDESISIKDESREEVVRFVDSLTNSQLEKIMEFVDSIPKIVHDVPFKCISCNHANVLRLEGLQDFFS
jgi:hypothetical protein